MSLKKGPLSWACLNAIVSVSELSAQYQDAQHMCRIHKDKSACENVKIINKQVTSETIDKLFNSCRS